jgi:hypothetical protein
MHEIKVNRDDQVFQIASRYKDETGKEFIFPNGNHVLDIENSYTKILGEGKKGQKEFKIQVTSIAIIKNRFSSEVIFQAPVEEIIYNGNQIDSKSLLIGFRDDVTNAR